MSSKSLRQGLNLKSGLVVLDPGHSYLLPTLDGWDPQVLRFVKRYGEMFPGNVGTQIGTTTQAVLRALIDRTKYVDNQIPDPRNQEAIAAMRLVIRLFEERAADRHGCRLGYLPDEIETCQVGVNGHLTDYWEPK